MKFSYLDESGDQGQGDVFIMVAVLIDAYRLQKHSRKFDEMISNFLATHPHSPKELKTKAFINGADDWSKVDAIARKQFLTEICELAAACATIYGAAFSFANFGKAVKTWPKQPSGKSYWLAAAMFIAALVQQKMQDEKKNKGLTVLICDDNKREMPNLSDALYAASPWFDPIYQKSIRKKGQRIWKEIPEDERFGQIIDTAFAIKSHHSSLVQVADVVAYVYRRHLELTSGEKENWDGEKNYYSGLVNLLDRCRARLGQNPGGECIEFYKAATHAHWKL
jgi:Protein of unknown function (DUF3800)